MSIRALFVVWIAASVVAQDPAPPAPAAPIADSRPETAAVPAAVGAAIDAVFKDWAAADTPGAAVGLYRGGKLVYGKGYGAASLEHSAPITSATVFDLASTSKQFTAACILLLMQDGKLALDDPLRRHLPELPAWADTTTIRHCLFHTSGIRDYLMLLGMAGVRDQDWTDDADALRAVMRQKAVSFPPGTRHDYSNSGYFLLSQVVRAVSGKTLAEFAAERVFRPLGMTSTRFVNDCTVVVPRRAASYEPRKKSFAITASDWQQTGDGGVLTTVEDLAHWVRNFTTGEVGGPAFLELMNARGALDDGRPLDYGYGLSHEARGGVREISHSGAWAGFRADLIRLPDYDLAVAVLANRADADPTSRAQKVLKIARDAGLGATVTATKPVAPAAPAAPVAPAAPKASAASKPAALPLSAFAGRWRSEELDAVWTIAAGKRGLSIACRGIPPLEAMASGPDVFLASLSVKLTFRRGADGRPSSFVVSSRGMDGVVFERMPDEGAK